MASKLAKYLQSISGNAAELKLFHSDPLQAAQKAGLSSVETAALISKNPGAISKAIKAEGGGVSAADNVNVTVVVVVAP